MNDFEKVELLREKANVTYEEAKDALKACNGDMLDAMVYLEKLGKVRPTVVEKTCKREKVKENASSIGQKLKNNLLKVERNGAEVMKLPLWAALLILLFTWEISFAIIVISIFFDVRYSIVGQDDMTEINKAMDKVSNVADTVKDEFAKA